ncbi:type 2 lantibiotic biosynthesis protein LanM [Enterococcus caccae]|nr:type 2 lantibiotic biosynthesis protein LanM [Enterococcus caccae]
MNDMRNAVLENKLNEQSYAFATTMKERGQLFSDELVNEEDNQHLKKWLERKSLMGSKLFETKLDIYGITEDEYKKGLRELTRENRKTLEKKLADQDWYQLHMELMNETSHEIEATFSDVSYIIRKHLLYLNQEIEKIVNISEINIADEALVKYIEFAATDMLGIIMRTVVLDVHEKKQQENNQEFTFLSYLADNFTTNEQLNTFYEKYPVLAKLLAKRLIFSIANFKEFINALNQSKKDISQLLNISVKNLDITKLKIGAGDSHGKGKTVIIVTFNQTKKLAFKFKNLRVGERFNIFLKKIEEHSEFSFYKVKRIYGESFTFEEFVEFKECENKKEAGEFYKGFGHLIALSYILQANDLHFENIIAHGKFPVIIDIETLIQNEPPIKLGTDAYGKFKYSATDSVVNTGLVPTLLFQERVAEEEKEKKGVQFSALSGGTQKLPFKVLKLTNLNSENMKYEYQDHILEGALNIPSIEGTQLNFEEYSEMILDGFTTFMQFVIQNKNTVAKWVELLFNDCLVRNVIKATQRYADMLDFSTHPTCTMDYKEREKLFENIWAYPYKDMRAVPFEVEDLLNHDIPIFFNNTGTKDLIASDGSIISDYYAEKPINRTVNKIKNLTEKEFQQQLNLLTLSLGLYDGGLEELVITSAKEETTKKTALSKAIAIGDFLLDRAIWGENKKTVTWQKLQVDSYDNWSNSAVYYGLYEGLQGIYLFFYNLNKIKPSQSYQEVIDALNNYLFKENPFKPANTDMFSGLGSILYLYTQLCKDSKNDLYLGKARTMVEDLIECTNNSSLQPDWVGGLAGFLKVLVELYKVTNDDFYLKSADQVVEKIDISEIKVGGFAHGYSGILTALNSFAQVAGYTENVKEKIWQALLLERKTFSVQKQTWQDLREGEANGKHFWCHGSAGIGMSRLSLLSSNIQDEVMLDEVRIAANNVLENELNNDGLCHGNYGNIEFLIQLSESNYADKELKRRINQYKEQLLANSSYKLLGLKNIPSVTLFDGLSGIGYELLRIASPEKVPNVLMLD